MNSLEMALDSHELATLRILGEWWELDLTGADKQSCVQMLLESMLLLNMQEEVKYLGPEESEAFLDLIHAGGRLPVAALERKHGMVRQMGPGRLEREEPWLDPVSPAESLWYRGFLFRAFDESEGAELVEYYYVPDELFGQFELLDETEADSRMADDILKPVMAPENVFPASGDAVDDVTTLLAAAQNQPLKLVELRDLDSFIPKNRPDRVSLLFNLAEEMGALRQTERGARPARPAIDWLKRGRAAQQRELADAWSRCDWNELAHTPGLALEGGGWSNDPMVARTAFLDTLPRTSDWYNIQDLITHIREVDPDFQRPDGVYDTWYIRDVATGVYLTGFEHWEQVEGRLVRYFFQGPLNWLGLADYAPGSENSDDCFRLSGAGLDWLEQHSLAPREVDVPIVVQPDASIVVPRNSNRYRRFQTARISEAEPVTPDQPYSYRLTPGSLSRAKEQGIDVRRVMAFLADASGRPVPSSTKRCLERWAENGVEARLESAVVILVRDASVLEKLRTHPKTRDFIDEPLGDLSALVRRGDWPKLRAAAARLGLLLDDSRA